MARRYSTKYSTRWFRICIGLCLVVFVFWKFNAGILRGFDLSRLIYAALAVQPFALVAMIVHSMRLGLLAGLSISNIRSPFSALLLSQGFNLVLPGRIAELFKVTYLHAYADIPLSRGMAAVVLERSVDLLIVAGLGLVGFALLSGATNGVSLGLAALVIAALILIPFLEKHLTTLTDHFPWPRLRVFFQELLKHIAETVRAATFYRVLVLGLATWAASFANIYLFVTLAGNKPVDFEGVLVLFVATTLGGAVPALPGGFGSYEAAAVLVLKSYGYNLEEALPLAIGMHLAQFVLPVLGSAFILSHQRVGVSSLLRQLWNDAGASYGKCKKEGD